MITEKCRIFLVPEACVIVTSIQHLVEPSDIPKKSCEFALSYPLHPQSKKNEHMAKVLCREGGEFYGMLFTGSCSV